MMNQDKELLCEVARGARTGADATQILQEKAQSQPLRDLLAQIQEQYHAVAREADAALSQMGVEPKPLGTASKAGMWMGTQMSTLTDRSDTHLAELLLQGSAMGLTELVRAKNRCPDVGQPAASLAEWLLSREQEGIEQAQKFL